MRLPSCLQPFVILSVAIFLLQCSCERKDHPGSDNANTVPARSGAGTASALFSERTRTQLQAFFAAKAQQARELYDIERVAMPPEIAEYFKAASRADWPAAMRLYNVMFQRAPQHGHTFGDQRLNSMGWQTINETCGAYELFAEGSEKYMLAFANDVIGSIPPGSIYFGGTVPGRCLITAFSRSHVNGDPIFTLTQNALADVLYLRYLRTMYGGKLYIPSRQDSERAFQEYVADAEERRKSGKLRADEEVRIVDSQAQVSGTAAVMAINGLLAKVVFERNQEREHFIEESFPLDWMYPRLTPHELILKVNREPLEQLSDEILQKDFAFWKDYTRPMIGTGITEKLSVKEVCVFVDKIYVRKDFSGFEGDRAYVTNQTSCKAFAKLRSSIAGVYAWRTANGSTAERERMTNAADSAFLESYALCPYSVDVVSRYVNWLTGRKRLEDALAIVQTAVKCLPKDEQLAALLRELDQANARKK